MLGHSVKRAASAAVLLLALCQGTAAKCHTKTVTCVDNKHDGTIYEAPDGVKFNIHCGVDYAGENLGNHAVGTFAECIDACERESACVGVSYIDTGACLLKGGNLHNPIASSHVWTAQKAAVGTAPSSTLTSDDSLPTSSTDASTDASTVTSASTSAAATSTEPPIPQGPKLNCTDGVPSEETFTTPAGREYQVLCGVDFAGGDIGEVKVSDFEACLDACDAASDRGCVTVAYNNGLCYFKDRFRNRIDRGHIWGALYLGPAPTGQSTTSSNEPTLTSLTSSEPEPTTTEEPIPTSWPDSPPLASSRVFPPEFDDSWMRTYTYMEVSMPVYTATGTNDPVPLPTTTGCVIGPDQLGAEFHLLDFNSGYVLKKGDEGQDRPAGPGFLTPPETEQEGRRLQAELAEWQPPVYGLERPEGVTDGPFDLVYIDNGKKLLFSVNTATGRVSFAEASSGLTTIFTVDCNGKFVVEKDGTKYNLLATESGRLAVEPQGPDGPSENNIVFLPKSAVPENPNSLAAAKRKAKRSYNGYAQGGWAPRCPNTPSNVWARLKPGARGNDPNGCGSKDNKVPDLNFRHCCNDHDNCFDDCGKTFELCNAQFLGCMLQACVNSYNRWYNSWLQPGCMATAGFYAAVVQSPAGFGPFKSAHEQRCECYCNGPADHHLCGRQCVNVRSNPSNCGGCGRTCPEGTHCSGLGCVCSKNTCGNLCLDFLTHPRNCGRCGNICSTGYCYQGVCSELPANPTTCLPREAFENGDFQRGDGSGWSSGANAPNSLNLGVFDGASSDRYGMVASFPANSASGASYISQRVHMCPGTNYDLTFKARRVSGDGTCRIMVQLGNQAILGWTNLPTTGASWQNFGPYRLSKVQLGQDGAQQGSRHYLTKQFTFFAECTGARSTLSTLRMDSFSIAPV